MNAEEVRDGMAKAMCAVETRSKAATIEEVQAGIQRWTRHRYEAERLIAEMADYGLTLAISSPPADDVREEPDLPNGHAPADDLPSFLARRVLDTDPLAVAVEAAVPDDISGWRFRYSERIASSIRAEFEVRLRGTVTDAAEPTVRMALRLGNTLRAAGYSVPMTVLRPALEDVFGARS